MRDDSIVYLTHCVSRLAGGLFQSVRHLAQNVAAGSEKRVSVIGLRDSFSDEDKAHWGDVDLRVHGSCGPGQFGFSTGIRRDLDVLNPAVVHVHGLWSYNSVAGWRWGARTGRPYLVSPRGMLEPWSLAQGRWKKRLATLLYQGRCLSAASCIHATSPMEAANIRRAGFHQPIAVIPNGVPIPPRPLPPRNRAPHEPRRALFLSRIHPKKGLLDLVSAWAELRPPGWELCIAGPDERGHLAEVRRAVRAASLEATVVFPGPVWGMSKALLYRSADLFILPTRSENFGLVIAEALSYEVPVITTRAAPWQELESQHAGWWVAPGAEPLIDALREATNLAPDALHQMGVRGAELIRQNYSWNPIAQQMLGLYDWLLRTGPRPSTLFHGSS